MNMAMSSCKLLAIAASCRHATETASSRPHATVRTDKDRLIDVLFARMDALEAKLNMNSQNSSKPPSSDGLAKKQKTSSLRGKSGKAVGGQPGHKGSTLKRVAEPTSTKDHPPPSHCNHCHSALALEQAHVLERRQVFDVPTMGFEVVEHRVYTVVCACGPRHDSVFPAAVNAVAQYGPNVRALGVHLTQGRMLPYARAAELIREMTGLSVSPATLHAWVGEASVALQGTADLIARRDSTRCGGTLVRLAGRCSRTSRTTSFI